MQERIFDLMQLGATKDHAADETCVKTSDLYSLAACESARATKDDDGERGKDKGGGASKKREERSVDEQLAASKKHAADLANRNKKLEAGGGGKGWGGGKGKGGKGKGGWGYDGWNQGRGGAPGNGPHCPDNICKDYNFKVSGCAFGAQCRKRHMCPVCYLEHPWSTCRK